LKEKISLEKTFFSKICQSKTLNFSCSSVINSRHSKLFNLISISELNISFFVSLALIFLTLGFNYLFYAVLSFTGLLAVVYTLFLQAFVIRKWCPICLITGLLILSINSTLLLNPYIISFDYMYYIKAISLLIIIFTLIHYIILNQKKIIRLEHQEIMFLALKRNKEIFNLALKKSNHINTNNAFKISFGALKPKMTLDVIINPNCIFCEKSFKQYHELIKKDIKNHIQLNVIFNVSDPEGSVSKILSLRIISIYENKGETIALEALKDWFEITDYNEWIKRYPISEFNESKSAQIKLKKQTDWCKKNEINYSPLTLVNGHALPKEYQVKDIRYFINNLDL